MNSGKRIRCALVGNPNCGKTTLFNALTGSDQYVGNWPGVTVERKEGVCKIGGREAVIVDLPGIYSMSPYTPEEVVARDYILDEHPDIIINIIDATNLERNLYLTTQLVELNMPVVVALNMTDLLKKQGRAVNSPMLAQRLSVPVVPISAGRGEGVALLMRTVHANIANPSGAPAPDIYGGSILGAVKRVEAALRQSGDVNGMPHRWYAVKLLEDGCRGFENKLSEPVKAAVRLAEREISRSGGADIAIADARYKWICGVCGDVRSGKKASEISLTDRIDAVAAGRSTGILLFIAVMACVFLLTFSTLGGGLGELVSGAVARGSELAREAGERLGASPLAMSFVCDGVISGVGSVLSFIPQIAILFTCLSALEDSGYMARAAFIADRLLRRAGLSGRSFVPMLMGFGCTVPAVMCSRTLESPRDKRLTVMAVPFMSCSAKMPVYAMISSALFPKTGGIIVSGIYFFGIAAAMASSAVLGKTVIKGSASGFVMELPEYRMPTARTLIMHVWDRLRDFILKAGGVILCATAAVWLLQSFSPV